MTYQTITQIKRANHEHGGYWFTPDTLRFFKSRVSGPVIGGRYFVSSERGPGMPRLYTIRIANEDGTIGTAGEFQAYTSKAQALKAARELSRAVA